MQSIVLPNSAFRSILLWVAPGSTLQIDDWYAYAPSLTCRWWDFFLICIAVNALGFLDGHNIHPVLNILRFRIWSGDVMRCLDVFFLSRPEPALMGGRLVHKVYLQDLIISLHKGWSTALNVCRMSTVSTWFSIAINNKEKTQSKQLFLGLQPLLQKPRISSLLYFWTFWLSLAILASKQRDSHHK